MDSRPSELDPYPRTERDLSSAVLWQRSLHRSHRRRIRAREARRNAPRQKGATLAAGAAILAAPVLSSLSGAASASSARPGASKAEVAEKAAVSGEKTWLLSYGDTGEAVAAVQGLLGIPADGIFGPQTEGAVKTFQLNQGLAATGIVDARTWAELFGSKVLFYGEADASATTSSEAGDADATASASSGAGETVNVVLSGDDLEESVGEAEGDSRGPRTRRALQPAPVDSAPVDSAPVDSAPGDAAPVESTPVESAPAPVSTGDGCTADGRMVAPVNGTVTGTFGEDRGDHAHSGTDIAAPTGTTVRAAECGTVSVSGTESGYGTMVCVRHAGETTTCYAHLSESSVAVNEYVKAGQKIGEVGCTGSCTGPHVHFEVRQNGVAENAAPYLSGSRTVAGGSAQPTSAAMPAGEGGIGGATPSQQAAVFNSSGGAQAPSAAKATTYVPAVGAARRGRSPGARADGRRAAAQHAATQPAAPAAPAAPAVEAAPVEAAPVEAAPVEAAPVEAAPVEAAPVEAAPVEAAPGRGRARRGRARRGRTGRSRTRRGRAGRSRAGRSGAGRGRARRSRARRSRARRSRARRSRARRARPVEAAPVEPAPVEPAPVEAAPAEVAPAEAAPAAETAPAAAGHRRRRGSLVLRDRTGRGVVGERRPARRARASDCRRTVATRRCSAATPA